jgi:hypothetical protein
MFCCAPYPRRLFPHLPSWCSTFERGRNPVVASKPLTQFPQIAPAEMAENQPHSQFGRFVFDRQLIPHPQSASTAFVPPLSPGNDSFLSLSGSLSVALSALGDTLWLVGSALVGSAGSCYCCGNGFILGHFWPGSEPI